MSTTLNSFVLLESDDEWICKVTFELLLISSFRSQHHTSYCSVGRHFFNSSWIVDDELHVGFLHATTNSSNRLLWTSRSVWSVILIGGCAGGVLLGVICEPSCDCLISWAMWIGGSRCGLPVVSGWELDSFHNDGSLQHTGFVWFVVTESSFVVVRCFVRLRCKETRMLSFVTFASTLTSVSVLSTKQMNQSSWRTRHQI